MSPIHKPIDLRNLCMFMKNSWEVGFGLGGVGPELDILVICKISGRLGGDVCFVAPNQCPLKFCHVCKKFLGGSG